MSAKLIKKLNEGNIMVHFFCVITKNTYIIYSDSSGKCGFWQA